MMPLLARGLALKSQPIILSSYHPIIIISSSYHHHINIIIIIIGSWLPVVLIIALIDFEINTMGYDSHGSDRTTYGCEAILEVSLSS